MEYLGLRKLGMLCEAGYNLESLLFITVFSFFERALAGKRLDLDCKFC
jgi:hypothetical protein